MLGDARERALMAKFAEVSRATVKGTLVIGLVQGALGAALERELEGLDHGDGKQLGRCAQRCRDLIYDTPLPEELATGHKDYRQWKETPA